MTSKYLKKQTDKLKEKKAAQDQDAIEAFKRTSVSKGKVMIPQGDIHRRPDQNFFVLSYCTADGATRVKSVKDLAMKFSPAFETQEEAEKWAQIIRDENPIFDVKVVSMYEWGTVPLPDEQRPFVKSVYASEIMTRAMAGLQRSMIHGKKEIDERKGREMAAAERAMQKVKGKDYKMPEKSRELREIEERIKSEREQKEKAATSKQEAASIIGSDEVKFTLSMITDIIMNYCKEHYGETIEPLTGAQMTQYISKSSLELEAQIRRAKASEFADEDPKNIPTAQEYYAAQAAEKEQDDTIGTEESLAPSEV
jgi:hypothetical protein